MQLFHTVLSSPIEVSHELRVRYSDADVTMKIHSVRALRLMCLGCLLVPLAYCLSTPLIPLAITGGISLYISLSLPFSLSASSSPFLLAFQQLPQHLTATAFLEAARNLNAKMQNYVATWSG